MWFWFGMVSQNYKNIAEGNFAEFREKWQQSKANFPILLSNLLIRELVKQQYVDDPIVSIGTYYDKHIHIDILAIRKSGKMPAGACKYTKEPAKPHMLHALKEKCKKAELEITEYVLFSKNGFMAELEQTQKKRFSVIASCIGELRQDSIVDAGGGFGDFYLYLKERENLPKTYIGLDLCAPMVAEAKVRTGCKIMQKDILRQSIPVADWYVASGSMNLLTRMEIGLFIQRCFERSCKGFVFNLLDGREQEGGKYSYWTPHEIRLLCQSLGGKIEIKEGYLEGDFTVILRS